MRSTRRATGGISLVRWNPEGRVRKHPMGRRTVRIGTLASVDPRRLWRNEATDFTPWLAQAKNLSLLSRALGLDLRLQDTEKPVRRYRPWILEKLNAAAELVRKLLR
ncbi:MAG: hypothetical protein KatS3mg076_0870 [Candidatus Binatia bacterium]|nr:MAG: hypothetical protein KatS3mg076_0870 [Candidatus Binatia bacterium]